MRALITGAGGFSAAHLSARLRQESIGVVGLDLREPDPHAGFEGECRRVDITDFEQVSKAVREVRPDYIFHLAGAMVGPFQEVYRANCLGTVTLLEAVRASAPDCKLLLVGSSAEYGPVAPTGLPVTEEAPCVPGSPYGLSKHFATLAGLGYARHHGLKIVVARVFNLVGAGIPESLVVGALLARAKSALMGPAPPVVKVGNLGSRRDFIAVTDAVDGYLRMVRADFWGEVFNICSGRARPIAEVAALLLDRSDRKIALEVDPALVRTAEVDTMFGSPDKARRLLGFEARTPLEDALAAAWDHRIGGGG